MPRQVLTVQTGSRTAAQAVVFTTVTVADGAEFVMPTSVFKPVILVRNPGTVSADVKVPFARTIDGVAPSPRTLACPNSATAVYVAGAFGDEYKQNNGKVNIDVAGASLDIAIVTPGAV